MEQAQYWTWMKKRSQILNSRFQASVNSMNNSWEEKAFAEDASRPLGGCIWPPRSYSCTFCNREFRSAQALGGHMNVHRRDRARLKQSFSPHNHVFQPQIHSQHPLKSLDTHFPSEVCTLDYSLDHPNSGFGFVASSTLSSPRVSSLHTQENLSDHPFMSPYSSSIIQEQPKQSSYIYNLSGSDSLAVRVLNISDSSKPEVEKNPREVDSTSLIHEALVETDLFMGLNSVISRNLPNGCCGDKAIGCCKRHKTAASSDKESAFQSEVIGLDSSSLEDIDLELRLGEPPKME